MEVFLLLRILAVSFVVLLGQTCCASRVLAQPMREVVVIPYGTPETGDAVAAAAELEAALSDSSVPVVSMHDARDRFTARSRPPRRLSSSDLDVIESAAHDAAEQVAFGRTAAAQKSVREVLTRAQRALESLNRDTVFARTILDACLALVRSSLQTGNRDRALDQAIQCRQLVPDLVPSRSRQPAEVIGVLSEADDLIARMRIGRLTVRSAPAEHCVVYLNGRQLGTTPFELDRAAEGAYRVQVECGESPGRVHMVQLGEQPASLLVDDELDRAIKSGPRLALGYEQAGRARDLAVGGAVSLGAELGADDVVLIAIDAGRAELSRIRVHQARLVGRVSLPWHAAKGFERASLERAIAALAEGRIEGTPELATPVSTQPAATGNMPDAATPVAVKAETAEGPRVQPMPSLPRRRAPPTRRRKLALGMTSLAIGAGLFATAGALYVRRRHDGGELRASVIDDASDQYANLVSTWSNHRPGPYIAAALGSSLLTSSALTLMLLSPRTSFPPWVTAVSAGVGLGLAVWGSVGLARGGPCSKNALDRQVCSDQLEQLDRGALLLLAAVPPLAVTLTQLLRPRRPNPRVRALGFPQLDFARRTLSLHASFSL